MKREKLKNLDEVQSYFVKRVEKIINAKGKKMIGWDEILQGGLAPNAAVMSWRGMKGGIEAAKQGHEVVMTPTDFVYIDYMQSDRIMEPPVYASLRLKKVLQFEPVPAGVDPKLIKGGQGNLWTEQVYTLRQAQYMTWPRALAIAEILWSPKEERSFPAFVKKVETQFVRLDAAKTKYAPSMYDPDFAVAKKDSDRVLVTLTPEVEGLQLHYSFDNSYPDEFYPVYKSPLLVPKDAFQLRVISYRDGKPIGRMITMPVEELKKEPALSRNNFLHILITPHWPQVLLTGAGFSMPRAVLPLFDSDIEKCCPVSFVPAACVPAGQQIPGVVCNVLYLSFPPHHLCS